MPKLKQEPKIGLGGSKPKVEVNGVFISLTAEDRRNATAAARLSNQTLAEWISSMVTMSLQP
jgi:hypothetical protein